MTVESISCYALRPVVEDLRALMIEHAFPLWSKVGWDEAHGGFVERLHASGDPDTQSTRRTRVQARQIYCFAKAAQLGWHPSAKQIALRGLDYLLEKARSPDGRAGFVHLLNPDGSVNDPLRDTYDHAFILLALSSVFGATGDNQVKTEIDMTIDYIDSELQSPYGGLVEGSPPLLPRRQNPHMHLFEAMIALFDATKISSFKIRAERIHQLFASKFYDPHQQIVMEYFENDWTPVQPAIVEPGHLAEWVWLLRCFERVVGHSTNEHRIALLNSALHYRDSSGCLVDEGNSDKQISKATRRLWPQTEIAKAWLSVMDCDQRAEAEACSALTRLKTLYLNHNVAGGWYDQFDPAGRSTVNFIPASSFYHILCAITEAIKAIDYHQAPSKR